jgi:hypothetical protein
MLNGQVDLAGLPFFADLHQDVADQAQAGSLIGEILTTSVRRCTSLFTRSTLLLVQSLRRCSGGKEKMVKPSGMFFSIQSARREAVLAYFWTVLAR